MLFVILSQLSQKAISSNVMETVDKWLATASDKGELLTTLYSNCQYLLYIIDYT
jgi:hypothetical protein